MKKPTKKPLVEKGTNEGWCYFLKMLFFVERNINVFHLLTLAFLLLCFYSFSSILAHNNLIFPATAANCCSILLQTDLIFVNLWEFTSFVFISGFKPRWKSSEVFITGVTVQQWRTFGPKDVEGMVQDRFVIKAHSGKSLFNLSSPTGVILLEAGRVYNMWILATHFKAP